MTDMLKKAAIQVLSEVHPGNEPGFIIAGAQKSATTSLHYYLNQHPDLRGSNPKEVCYFHDDRNYRKGKEWYRKAFINFRSQFKKGLFFETTPENLYYRKAPARIYDFNRDMKIIIILREPVQRAFSAWTMYRMLANQKEGLPDIFYSDNELDMTSGIVREFFIPEEFPTFEQVIQSEISKIDSDCDQEEPGLLRRGIYLPQIRRYHKFFGKDQVLILGFNELVGNLVPSLNRILDFLGLPESSWVFLNCEKRNANRYLVKLQVETKRFLKDFYQPYNEELFNYLGYQPDW